MYLSGSAKGAETRVGEIKELISEDFFFLSFDWWNRRKFLCVMGKELNFTNDLAVIDVTETHADFFSYNLESIPAFKDFTTFYQGKLGITTIWGNTDPKWFFYNQDNISLDTTIRFTKRACAK